MTPDYNQAWSYVQTLAGDPTTAVMDWRALSDWDKSDPGHARRGTLPEWWEWLCSHNALGYGIFVTVAAMDGVGRHLANVDYLRAVYVDLDNTSAQQNYVRACEHDPAPSFAVVSSVGKSHVYWTAQPFRGNDRFQAIQRRARQLFDGDRAVIDAARVLRVPGWINHKYSDERSAKYTGAAPHLVTCHSLDGYGQYYTPEALEASLAHVNIIDGGNGDRKPLGDLSLAAPSLEWVHRALELTDPNSLDRLEWVAFSAGIKQAAWSLTDADSIYTLWCAWCARYEKNDPAENFKQWSSLRETALGWPSILKRAPGLHAQLMFGARQNVTVGAAHLSNVPPMPSADVPVTETFGEFLTAHEQANFFAGITFITTQSTMLCPSGRFLAPQAFNAEYGGKRFMIDAESKVTDEAWKAATRSTLWQVPKADHIRFVPSLARGAIIEDALKRKGVNVYQPATIKRIKGDVSPFLNHLAKLLPVAEDRKILLDYLAHNVRFPGDKIPWAPLIQSTEGAGKGMIKQVMQHAIGEIYTYQPKASELAASGAKFNAWLANRLFIIVDEVKTDEKRELLEVLKPLLSEKQIEIQRKGVDQELQDNFSNWLFFSNWKDAIPIDRNGRRWAIMFSALQTYDDLIAAGMDGAYFDALYGWLDMDGAAVVADYLLDYPIERGMIPMRAPYTSSSDEAAALSVSPIERVIREGIEDGLPGFRDGWLSSIAILKRIRDTAAARTMPGPQLIGSIVEKMGYSSCGRAARGYSSEGSTNGAIPERAYLWHLGGDCAVDGYGAAQGFS